MRTFLEALHPTHSRPSPPSMAVHPPMSGESHHPHVPGETFCDVTRMDVDMAHDRDPDSLVGVGAFDPQACALPAPTGSRASAPEDRDCAGPGTGAAYLDCRRIRLDAGRLTSRADPEPVPGSPAGVGHCPPVRVPRPGRGFEHPEPRGSTAFRPHRRGCRELSGLPCAQASRFIGFGGSGPDADAARAQGVMRGPPGTNAQCRGPAARLHAFRPSRACDRSVSARDPVIPTRLGHSPDRLSPKGRSCLGRHSCAWPGSVSTAGSKTK